MSTTGQINPRKNEFWGRAAWHTLHCAAASANTEEKRKAFKEFVPRLFEVLSCDECITHARENLRNFPITDEWMTSNEKLLFWTYVLHDRVNKQINQLYQGIRGYTMKTSPPYDDVKKYYFENLGSNGCDECTRGSAPARR